jgi:RNA recognition motif-containing protein
LKIYAGNLAEDVTDEDLRTFFAPHGQVTSASVVKDRFSDRSRGFGFVEMPNEEEGKTAIRELHGKELKASPVTVNVARPRGETGPQRGGGDRGRGGPRRF